MKNYMYTPTPDRPLLTNIPEKKNQKQRRNEKNKTPASSTYIYFLYKIRIHS